MRCPKCSKETLDAFAGVEGVDVDFCSTCHGIWFDEGELAFYTETLSDFPDLATALAQGRGTQLVCPRCGKPSLTEIRYARDADLMLDVCPGCKGVFVDRSELRKVEVLAGRMRSLAGVGRVVRELDKRGYQVLGGRKI